MNLFNKNLEKYVYIYSFAISCGVTPLRAHSPHCSNHLEPKNPNLYFLFSWSDFQSYFLSVIPMGDSNINFKTFPYWPSDYFFSSHNILYNRLTYPPNECPISKKFFIYNFSIVLSKNDEKKSCVWVIFLLS